MKLEIVYKLGKMHFSAVADSISEAYEYIKAIIDNGVYVRPSDELDKYMCWLVEMYNRPIAKQENSLIRIRALKEESDDENTYNHTQDTGVDMLVDRSGD